MISNLCTNKKIHILFAVLAISCLYFYLFKDTIVFHWEPYLLSGPLSGDQGAHLWYFERALQSKSFDQYMNVREFTEKGSFNLRSIPFEWYFIYAWSKFCSLFNLTSPQIIAAWFSISLYLNLIAAFSFLYFACGSALTAFVFCLSLGIHASGFARLEGHPLFVALWPCMISILFLAHNFKKIIISKSTPSILSVILMSLFYFITINSSYTYFLFLYLISFSFLGFFAIFYYKLLSKQQINDVLLKIVSPIIMALICSIPFVLHVFIGDHGFKESGIATRGAIGVSIFSARFTDFVKPFSGTVLYDFFNFRPSPPIGRGELYSFLGTSLAFLIVIGIILAITKAIKKESFNLKIPTQLNILLILSIVTVFFTTKFGGYTVYYLLSKGVRSYNRMAPFASLMIASFFAILLHSKLKDRRKLYLTSVFIILSLNIYDITHTRFTARSKEDYLNRNAQIEKIKVRHNEFSEICKNGTIKFSTDFFDFFSGPLSSLYFLEHNKCQAVGFKTNFYQDDDKSNLVKPVKAILTAPSPAYDYFDKFKLEHI